MEDPKAQPRGKVWVGIDADKAVEAAGSQRTQVPGEAVTASIVADLARQILEVDNRLKDAAAGCCRGVC